MTQTTETVSTRKHRVYKRVPVIKLEDFDQKRRLQSFINSQEGESIIYYDKNGMTEIKNSSLAVEYQNGVIIDDYSGLLAKKYMWVDRFIGGPKVYYHLYQRPEMDNGRGCHGFCYGSLPLRDILNIQIQKVESVFHIADFQNGIAYEIKVYTFHQDGLKCNLYPDEYPLVIDGQGNKLALFYKGSFRKLEKCADWDVCDFSVSMLPALKEHFKNKPVKK